MATVFVKPTSPLPAPGPNERDLRFRHPAQGELSRPLPAEGDHWPNDTHTHRMVAEGSIEIVEPPELPSDDHKDELPDTRTPQQRYAEGVSTHGPDKHHDGDDA